MDAREENQYSQADTIESPAPTAWPMVFALGVSLLLASMVTNIAIGLLGLVLALAGVVGWFRQVLPHAQEEAVPVSLAATPIVSTRTSIGHLAMDPMHRKMLPIETFRMTTGIKGGIAGGIAMTIPAGIYSLVKYHSIWYAMNLLAAGGFLSWAGASDAFLSEFHLRGLLAALAIHGLTSVLVGLLYGAMLPMFPKYPILTAGFVAPLLWSGLLSSVLGIVSPILNARIDWWWFVPSQIAFGLVAGYVVNLQEKVRTPQFRALPFAVRAGIEMDMGEGRKEEEGPR
jgi:hypothetical protein